jgi:hypothetical protein
MKGCCDEMMQDHTCATVTATKTENNLWQRSHALATLGRREAEELKHRARCWKTGEKKNINSNFCRVLPEHGGGKFRECDEQGIEYQRFEAFNEPDMQNVSRWAT